MITVLDQEVFGIGKVPLCSAFNDIECKSLRYSIMTADRTDAETLIGYIMEGAAREEKGREVREREESK